MAPDAHWDMTPRQSVGQECARRGAAEVVATCVGLLGSAGPGRRGPGGNDPDRRGRLTG
jgi:hypothetical protein